MAGVVLEQHPDRARLFMQWKQMDWPLMWDPYNLLGLTAVPLTLLLDEDGVIRLSQPLVDKLDDIESAVLTRRFDAPVGAMRPTSAMPDLAQLARAAWTSTNAAAWGEYAVALTLWGGDGDLDDAVDAARQVVALQTDDASQWFALGVNLRRRYDSDRQQAGDFQAAVDAWARALDVDPNNYIWRRRLQQYGPRLDKPYPFYDWVPEALAEIEGRGITPVTLTVEPSGAEFAEPAQVFGDAAGDDATLDVEPDPDSRILADEEPLIDVETTVIPPRLAPGDPARVHVVLTPNTNRRVHWNNEAGETILWIDPPDGWETDVRHLTLAVPPDELSVEPRRFEFELRAPEDIGAGVLRLRGYALYYICEDITGVCLFRRQDIEIELSVTAADQREPLKR